MVRRLPAVGCHKSLSGSHMLPVLPASGFALIMKRAELSPQ